MVNEVQNLVEVELKHPDDFLKVKETLERIGVTSKSTNTLYQSCHILHKRGKLYIVHFKEMFLLDGKTADFTDTDTGRRNTICKLLEQWGLVTVVNPSQVSDPIVSVSSIKILPFSQKSQWTLKSKYTIGRK
jgi:hypothetical protein